MQQALWKKCVEYALDSRGFVHLASPQEQEELHLVLGTIEQPGEGRFKDLGKARVRNANTCKHS